MTVQEAVAHPMEATAAAAPAPAAAGRGAGRGAALRDSMRQLLQKKAAAGEAPAAGATSDAAAPAVSADSRGYPSTPSAPASAVPASASAGEQPKAQSLDVGSVKDRGEVLRDALREAPRGEAVRASMRQLLKSKKAAAGERVADSSAVVQAQVDPLELTAASAQDTSDVPAAPLVAGKKGTTQDEDPWPELPLSRTTLGVEDGRRRAAELNRRGDFENAARMWAKVLWVAHNCRGRISASDLAELEEEHAAALALVPAPVSPSNVCLSSEAASSRSGPPPAKASDARAVEAPEARAVTASDARNGTAAQAKDTSASVTASVDAGASATASVDDAPTCAEGTVSNATAAQACLDGAAAWNQAFFNEMEKDYQNLCAEDGWDAIISRQEVLKTRELSKLLRPEDDIPADSDYFRVQLPATSRELRPDPAATLPKPKEAPRPPRNLDELRRVEAATREAIEREKAKYAARSKQSGNSFSPQSVLASTAGDSDEEETLPIRTKSDTVRIDKLSDSDDDEESGHMREKVRATYEAFQEYEKLAREKEERLARWRKRYGAD